MGQLTALFAQFLLRRVRITHPAFLDQKLLIARALSVFPHNRFGPLKIERVVVDPRNRSLMTVNERQFFSIDLVSRRRRHMFHAKLTGRRGYFYATTFMGAEINRHRHEQPRHKLLSPINTPLSAQRRWRVGKGWRAHHATFS